MNRSLRKEHEDVINIQKRRWQRIPSDVINTFHSTFNVNKNRRKQSKFAVISAKGHRMSGNTSVVEDFESKFSPCSENTAFITKEEKSTLTTTSSQSEMDVISPPNTTIIDATTPPNQQIIQIDPYIYSEEDETTKRIMGMIQIRCHQIAFLYFTACFAVYLLIFFCRNYPVESMGKSGFLEASEVYQIVDYGEQDNYGSSDKLSPKSLLLLKLHLVERDFNGNFTSLLRGYAFSRCHDQYHNTSLPAIAILVKENNLMIPGVIRHNGLTCPWQWSPRCNWNTFYVEFDIPSDVGETIKEVTFINLFTKQMATISVTRPVAKSKEELMVCVPPLYWYNNHLQLFIFVETWRLQGASHFIFYYSTVSMDVFNLLKYYEAMGIVSMIPFKSLPMNKRINPNVSIYRYGHILAINDCLLRRKAKFATVVDVDEFLVPVGNKTFVDFVKSEFNKDEKAAVLYFQHSALHFDLKKINDGFGFLLHTRKSTIKGPTKYVAVPERIRNVDSHAVSKIFGNYTSKGMVWTTYLYHAFILIYLTVIGPCLFEKAHPRRSIILKHNITKNSIGKSNLRDLQTFRYNSKYVFVPNVIKAKTHMGASRISLVLHASDNYVNGDFVKHVNNWDGPISVGVYINSPTINSIESICAYCKLINIPNIDHKVSVHFIYAISRDSNARSVVQLSQYLALAKCSNTVLLHKICKPVKVSEEKKIENMLNYPINVVRNIARKLTLTHYILIADLDHMFSEHFEEKVLYMARKLLTQNTKRVLVYRIFEVDDSAEVMPRNKEMLYDLMAKRKAQIFHRSYPKGHAIPLLGEWFKVKDSAKPGVQVKVLYHEKAWEPQYVSLRNIPDHDTTFHYPLRDNTATRWQMCRENYEFLVMNDVFMYHRGIKKDHENKTIEKARARAWGSYVKALANFSRRMDIMYPKTKSKCPALIPKF
uniref:Glycosyltransferase family 92 protein n=1 Tax=Rhabditophanes sp. KR3021 TaxID=114890 RepID=A0AC35UCK1_9BILA